MNYKNNTVLVGVSVLIKKDGKIILIKRKGSHGAGTWAPPGGHLDFGESILECAERETKEEVGLEIKNLKVIGLTQDLFKKEKKHYITIWVESEWNSGEARINNDEMSEIGWFFWESLPESLFLCLENFLKNKIYLPR